MTFQELIDFNQNLQEIRFDQKNIWSKIHYFGP
jgi:hypothetical protein